MGDYTTLADADKKAVIDAVEQEYLAYLFINNSNAKLHSQLKKDIANDYSKGNIKAYPNGQWHPQGTHPDERVPATQGGGSSHHITRHCI